MESKVTDVKVRYSHEDFYHLYCNGDYFDLYRTYSAAYDAALKLLSINPTPRVPIVLRSVNKTVVEFNG